ncbi:MAG: polysaccharide deacetylase family protein [Nocardioidaceae bacterium]
MSRILAVTLVAATLTVGVLAPSSSAAGPVMVSLTFNDSLSTQFRNARPVLRAHGVNGTFYVASNYMLSGDPKYMQFFDLDTLYREGDEVGGMGRDHQELTRTYSSDPDADLAYKQDQVCGDRAKLADLGYDPQSFAYPGGAWSSAAASVVSGCGYLSGRLVGGLSPAGPAYTEPVPPINAFALNALNTPADAVTLSELEDAVIQASSSGGGWLPIAFNDVCSPGAADYSTCMSAPKPVDSTVLSSFLDWLQTAGPAGTSVRTVRDVMGASAGPPAAPRPTTVSLTFDDGLASQYAVRGILSSHGDHGTFYINSGAVDAGEPGAMSWAQIHDLRGGGNDIAGHTRDHIDVTSYGTYDQRWHQVCDDRARLVEQGFSPAAFAYPFAAFNATAEEIVRGCGYQSGRSGGSLSAAGPHYAETMPPKDPFAIWTLGTTYNGPITLQVLQDAVTAAMAHGGGWLPTLFHEICYPGNPSFNSCMAGYRPVSSAVFDAFLGWLDTQQANGVSVRTITDVMSGGATPPVVKVTSPATGSTVTAVRPVLNGTTSSSGGDVTVSLYSGTYSTGTPLATLTAGVTSGAWSAQTSADLAAGVYTARASQQSNGVVGTSTPVSFTVGQDTSPPAVTITAPAEGATVATATPSVTGTAGTATDDGPVAVTVRDPDSALIASRVVAVGAGGTWAVALAALPDGAYVVTAEQTDAAGNLGTSGARHFSVDTVAPAVTLTSPAPGSALVGTSLTASGAASSSPGDAVTVTLAVYAGSATTGTPVRQVSGSVTGGAWTATATGLTARTYTLVARQTDNVGNVGSSSTVTVTLAAAGMAITSANPSTVGQGATGRTVTLAGSGIPVGATAVVLGGGVPVTSSTRVSATSLRLVLAADAGAGVGARDVVVSAPGQSDATCRACLTVTAAPTVAAVTPNQLGRGATNQTVVLSGGGFTTSTQVTVSGAGVTVPVTSRTASSISLRVSVTAGAAVGPRDLTLTSNDGGRSVCTGCFTVLDEPRVTAVSPSTVRRGLTTTVTLTGTSFDPSISVTVAGGGITIVSLTYVSPTSATLTVRVGAGAALGGRSVTVTSGTTKGTSALVNALSVVI